MKYELVKNLFFEVLHAKTKHPDYKCSALMGNINIGDVLMPATKYTYMQIFDLLDSKYMDKESNVYIAIRDLVAYKYTKTKDIFELTKPISYVDFISGYESIYKDLNMMSVALTIDYFYKILESYQDMVQADFMITCPIGNTMNRFISNLYRIKSNVIDILSKNKIEETELRDVDFENEVLKRPLLIH
jgi:hypothetical protein